MLDFVNRLSFVSLVFKCTLMSAATREPLVNKGFTLAVQRNFADKWISG